MPDVEPANQFAANGSGAGSIVTPTEGGGMRNSSEPKHPNTDAQAIARGLGWFSIVLGVTELLAPAAIRRNAGAPGPNGLLRAFGLREIVTGVMILSSPKPVTMVWGRVAGDMLDLAALSPAAARQNPHRAGGIGALAFVAAVTALDVFVALQGDETNR